jgi:hypothetical protein
VAAVSAKVEAGLSDAVCANRVAAWSITPPALHLASWREERAAFARRLTTLASSHRCLVFVDVRDCYASISARAVGAALRSTGCEPSAIDAVEAVVEGFAALGIRGLPVGPDPSPVLANAVLAVADRALERAGVAHLRWVDDVVAGVADRVSAERVVGILGGTLAARGLRLNPVKTRVVVDPPSATPGPWVSMPEGPGEVG